MAYRARSSRGTRRYSKSARSSTYRRASGSTRRKSSGRRAGGSRAGSGTLRIVIEQPNGSMIARPAQELLQRPTIARKEHF